jgi:Na+(H+)/acetate symporter ActP
MKQLLSVILPIASGLLCIVFRERFARGIANFQNKLPRVQDYNEREIRAGKVIIVIVGIFGILIGLATLFNIIEPR